MNEQKIEELLKEAPTEELSIDYSFFLEKFNENLKREQWLFNNISKEIKIEAECKISEISREAISKAGYIHKETIKKM